MIASLLILPFLGCDSEPAAPAAEAPALEAPAVPAEPAEPAAPAAPAEAKAGEWTHYGSEFTLSDALTAAELLGEPAKYVDQNVLVEGRVTDVCQKAGCWMVITDDTTTMRVLMKDHGFAVDKGGTGATCRIEGTLVAKEIDPEFVAHLESESQNTADMPEKQATGNTVYELNATGVAMMKAEG
ncbi:MAG: DUF4920 domain-containing protein [Myxococcota bacterium]|nr:DUF4920 domain-containing protein [Myxococcota bacterium]